MYKSMQVTLEVVCISQILIYRSHYLWIFLSTTHSNEKITEQITIISWTDAVVEGEKKKSPQTKCWLSCPDSDSLLVCQWPQLYCYEYYVPLMTLSISDKPPFVGLSPQFSFTGEGVEKGACIVFSCSLSSDCWHTHNNVKSLNISRWSSSSGLQRCHSVVKTCIAGHMQWETKPFWWTTSFRSAEWTLLVCL